MREFQQKQILSIGFITSILLLLINDFYLKANFPGIITGKLSDFMGLFAFPFFFSVLIPDKKKWIYAITVLIFMIWKLPVADNFISFWNQFMPYSINRVVDFTDYIALFILPISYFYKPEKNLLLNVHFKKTATFFIAFIAVFSFLATAGTHGKIKGYQLNYSKYEVNQAMQTFYEKHPEHIVPNQFESMVNPHFFGSPDDDRINRLNADSVNFDFYFEQYNMILWSSFVGSEKNWKKKPCELVFEGYLVISEGKWKFNNDLTKEEKQNTTNYFEKEILVKLQEILEK